MIKTVYETKYLIGVYDDEKEIYTSTYLPTSVDMTDDEWQDLMKNSTEIMKLYKPKYIIDDNTDRRYYYPPDLQEWMLKLFIECWHTIELKKYVQVLPSEIVGEISSMQLQDLILSEFDFSFEIKPVNDLESAKAWINESFK